MGEQIKPSDYKFFKSPDMDRIKNRGKHLYANDSTLEHLQYILEFYDELKLEKVVELIKRDIHSLNQKI
jgi:hypothetical protein